MKKGWRIIFGIVLVAVVFGGLCCGVGFLTGADSSRIILTFDQGYENGYTAGILDTASR